MFNCVLVTLPIYEDVFVEMCAIIFAIKKGSRLSILWLTKLSDTGQGLWCLNSISVIFQLYRGGQLYKWRNSEKTTDLPQSLINFIT
jgi:hypothetical protein